MARRRTHHHRAIEQNHDADGSSAESIAPFVSCHRDNMKDDLLRELERTIQDLLRAALEACLTIALAIGSQIQDADLIGIHIVLPSVRKRMMD